VAGRSAGVGMMVRFFCGQSGWGKMGSAQGL